MGEWFGCSGKRKDWRHTFYFVWNDLKKKWGSCCWWRGAFSCIIFSRHQMEDSADKHEGMCRSLSHRVFSPQVLLLLLLIYFSPTWWRSWHWADFLALVQMRSGVMWKKRKRIFPPAGVGVGVCCHHICSSVVDWMSFRCHVSAVDCPTRWVNSLFTVFSSTVYLNSICCCVLS